MTNQSQSIFTFSALKAFGYVTSLRAQNYTRTVSFSATRPHTNRKAYISAYLRQRIFLKSNMLMTVAAIFLSFGIGNVFTICFLRIHLLTFNLSDVVQSERVKTEKSKFNHCRFPRHLWQGNFEKENWQAEKQNRLNNS